MLPFQIACSNFQDMRHGRRVTVYRFDLYDKRIKDRGETQEPLMTSYGYSPIAPKDIREYQARLNTSAALD